MIQWDYKVWIVFWGEGVRRTLMQLFCGPLLINSASCVVFNFQLAFYELKTQVSDVIWNRWGRLFFSEIARTSQNNNLRIN